MKRIHHILLFAVLSLPSAANAQWDTQQNPDGLSPYFINGEYGFLYSYVADQGSGTPLEGLAADPSWDTCIIRRTTDSGRTWVNAKDYGGMDGTPLGMYFVSPSKGYIAISQSLGLAGSAPAQSGGLYQTLDSGMTWRRISPFSIGYDAVYAFGDTILASASSLSDLKNDPEDMTERSGIMRSTDAGKTWEQISLSYMPGHDIDGNDEGLVVAIPNVQSQTTIAVSTNYGTDWKNYSVPQGYRTNVYIPRNTQYVFASESEAILRSRDGGKTWDKCYTVQAGGKVLLGVDGDGCVVYAQTGDRIIRSTDWGDTWYVVNNLGVSTYKGLSVVGNGAVVYAKLGTVYPSRLLARTTNGGDYSLSPSPTAEALSISRQGYTSNGVQFAKLDTLQIKLCDSLALGVQFTYSAQCNHAWLKSVELTGLGPNLSRTSIRSRRSTADSATVWVMPTVAGTYNVTMHVLYEEDDWTVRDSVFPLVLLVSPNPSTLTVESRHTLDFGLRRLCNPMNIKDSFSISALGCDPYRVQAIHFEDDNANSGYSFTPASDLTLSPDGRKVFFYISFSPKRAGQFTGRIIVEHQSGSDTILVSAQAEEDSRTLVLRSDTLRSQLCDSSEGYIELFNTSCRLITLEVLSIPSPIELMPGQLPMGIPAGRSIQIRVRFTPNAEGPQSVDALASLRFVGQTETVNFDTLLTVQADGRPGTPLTVTTDTTISLGDVSICRSVDFEIPIHSLGCGTLTIGSVTLLDSDKGYAITTMPASLVPMNESTSAILRFAPISLGISITDLVISTNAGSRKIRLIANGVSGTRTLAASSASIDFGETNICEERDSTVRLANNGCDTLTITSADVDKNFSVGGSYPIKLAPGESIDLPITTIVDTVGRPTVLTGNLTIASTADNQIPPIALLRSLSYPSKLRIEAIDDASGKAGDVVKFKVLLEGQVPSTMTALHFDFLHNGDLLSWDQYDGIGLNRTSISGDEQQRSSFTLSPVHDGVVGEFSFRTNLALAEQTTLSFDNIRFDAAGVTFAPECIAVISDSGSRFNYIYTCGDNIIRDRLNGTRLIKSIIPNPAKDEIRVELKVAGSAEISVFNALGVEVVKTGLAKIDVSSLAAGVYYVRVASAGSVETRRMVVTR